MQRYFIYLAYDGTNYHGWQVQPNGSSVQQCITDALQLILRSDIQITGAGRTDTGVHARMMVAHFDSEINIDCKLLADKLNALLPSDISIYKILPVSDEAHARFSAVSRTYKYYLTTVKDPFHFHYECRIPYPVDFQLMNRAASFLLQTSDFTSFCKLHSNSKTNICHVTLAEWTQCDENRWVFTIKADRFLRNMVRAIVGTLLDVGRGKLNESDFKDIISRKDRCKAGSSAPAEGLFLYDIEYPEDIFSTNQH
jgi:tRNA pseudouridine38-40 synthase